MPDLYITQAKPNPTGKDRSGSIIPNQQLAAEWVDIKNISNRALSLQNVQLWHIAHTPAHPNGEWQTAASFNFNLGINETLRVHSGGVIPLSTLYPEDRTGADKHFFTGNSYIWNNPPQTDTPRIVVWNNERWDEIDKATYSGWIQEGTILIRRGELLA